MVLLGGGDGILVGLLFAVQVGTFIEVVLYTKKEPDLPFLKQ